MSGTGLINFSGQSTYNVAKWNDTSNIPIVDMMSDDNVTPSGWGLTNYINQQGSDAIGATSTSGDAAWVDDSRASQDARWCSLDEGTFASVDVVGLNNGYTYDVECFSSGHVGRTTRWIVNDDVDNPLDLPNDDGAGGKNSTETVKFLGVRPVNGRIRIGYGKAPGSGTAAANAARIIEYQTNFPAIGTEFDVEPGQTVTGTYVNMASVPATGTLSQTYLDAGDVEQTRTVTVDITDNTDGTFQYTVPDINVALDTPTAYLHFGDFTLTLDDGQGGTVTASSSLIVPADKTFVVLEEGFEPYIFQNWPELEQPVVGDIIGVVTADVKIGPLVKLKTNVEATALDFWHIALDGTLTKVILRTTDLPWVGEDSDITAEIVGGRGTVLKSDDSNTVTLSSPVVLAQNQYWMGSVIVDGVRYPISVTAATDTTVTFTTSEETPEALVSSLVLYVLETV